MNASPKLIFLVTFSLGSLMLSCNAIGYNGRVDILQTVNHKEEIESLLNKRYSGESAPPLTSKGGEIYHLKEIIQKDYDDRKWKDEDGSRRINNRKAVHMAATNGYMISSEVDNVVAHIVEASEIVERESMI